MKRTGKPAPPPAALAHAAGTASEPEAPRERKPSAGIGSRDTTDASQAAVPMPAQPPSSATTAIARVPMSVRWGDLDAFNHVNNATFLVYAQEARLAWLAGIDGVWFDETMMPVVAAAQVNFRRQLAWPAQIVVELTATRIGNSSLTIAHRIVAADDRACTYADGDVVMVWVEPASGRSVSLPAAIRSACEAGRLPLA